MALISARANIALTMVARQGLRFTRLGIQNPSRHYLHPIQRRAFGSTVVEQGQAGLARAPEPDLGTSEFILNHRPPVERKTHVRPTPARAETEFLEETSVNHQAEEQSAVQAILTEQNITPASTPAYHIGTKFDRVPYWQKINRWKDVTEEEFLSYAWSTSNNIQGKLKLGKFLEQELPEIIPQSSKYEHIKTRDDLILDIMDGIAMAPMSIRLPPHIIASIDWSNPLEDPLWRQFIPMKSAFQPDHPMLSLDSLHEKEDSPCEGLVHRYTDKCLFLASSHCPLYCRYCTRSYAVGADTQTVQKASLKPSRSRWDTMLEYIAKTPVIQDVVISGGDSYSLSPLNLRQISHALLEIPHIRRFRIATKGLAVAPSRTLDPEDSWTDELIDIVRLGRKKGVHIALHTHFNHPNEFSWVTREAAQKLFENGVTVRNQSVLLKGVNDDVETMGRLIRDLADCNIIPYYIYAHDLVRGVEDLRTPLQTILDLETQLRGSIAGFMTPQFVVDLPGGGGKRLAASYGSYDRETGVSTFVAPAVHGKGKEDRVYEYYDPLGSLGVEVEEWKSMMERRGGKVGDGALRG